MSDRDPGVSSMNFVVSQAAWYDGIDRAMEKLGATQTVKEADLIAEQNSAISGYWRVAGAYILRAMLQLSESTGVYPEELRDARRHEG